MGKRLGRYISHYRNDYFIPDQRNQNMIYSYKPKPGADKEIYRRVADITISMKSTDYIKMPECIYTEYSVSLSEDEIEVYKTMKNDLILTLDGGDIDSFNAAGLSNKLAHC